MLILLIEAERKNSKINKPAISLGKVFLLLKSSSLSEVTFVVDGQQAAQHTDLHGTQTEVLLDVSTLGKTQGKAYLEYEWHFCYVGLSEERALGQVRLSLGQERELLWGHKYLTKRTFTS